MVSPDLLGYYRRRAAEYEAFYAKPERQPELAFLRTEIPARLAGRRVLEVACGTGYWTVLASSTAQSILATDAAEEPMRFAQAKAYPRPNVRFALADAYDLGAELGSFDAALAVFWWSHIPLREIPRFLASLHRRLEPGARVLLMDNTYVEGSSTPIAERDGDGNTYQLRPLSDGTENRVLKNFPGEAELRAHLAPYEVSYRALKYYWLAEYTLA